MDLTAWKKIDKNELKMKEIRSVAPCFGLKEWREMSKEELLTKIQEKIDELPDLSKNDEIKFRKKTKAELVQIGLVLDIKFGDLKRNRDDLKKMIQKRCGEVNIVGLTDYPKVRPGKKFIKRKYNSYSIGELRFFVGDSEKKMGRTELLTKLGVKGAVDREIYEESEGVDWKDLVTLCEMYWVTGGDLMSRAEIRQEIAYLMSVY